MRTEAAGTDTTGTEGLLGLSVLFVSYEDCLEGFLLEGFGFLFPRVRVDLNYGERRVSVNIESFRAGGHGTGPLTKRDHLSDLNRLLDRDTRTRVNNIVGVRSVIVLSVFEGGRYVSLYREDCIRRDVMILVLHGLMQQGFTINCLEGGYREL